MVAQNQTKDAPDAAVTVPLTERLSYNLEEVSALTSISVFKLRDMLKKGELKGVKAGYRTWVVSRDNLTAYLNGDS